MIKEINGDLIRDGQGILCHQVNFYGVMAGGVAAAIANRLLSEDEYGKYQRLCALNDPDTLMGYVHYSDTSDGRLVANMFCQKDFNAGSDITDYQAMQRCFAHVRKLAAKKGLPVSIPGHIGCGIAGGDWEKVKYVINLVFGGPGVDATIIHWDRSPQTPPPGEPDMDGGLLLD